MRRMASALLLWAGCAASGVKAMDAGAGSPIDAGSCLGGQVSREVQFPSGDGLLLHGTFVNPCGGAPAPTVVLAHQLCRDRAEWNQPTHDWVGAFAQRHVATLAIDLRGHGASTLWPDGSTHDLCAQASEPNAQTLYPHMVGDVQSALAYARENLGASAVGVLGSSIGANSAIVAYANNPPVAIVVALSPGLDYRGIQTTAPVQSMGARPALLEAARDDARSADAVTQLVTSNPSVMSMVWPSGGHGNAILDAHPEELTRVADLIASKL